MSKAAQLKKKAAEFEQKKQFDRALASYVQAIDASVGVPDEIDIPLYNRVGDLHFRLGEVDKALSYYERAVDLYTEGGFFNNAIALCNKVLRHAPSRSSIYYKLGRISAKKGFNSDAKQNFLEYAGRMQKAGQLDEAFRALKEFADLCPGQDDVRLMLAEQLSRVGRSGEALEQLQLVYDAMLAEGRTKEASATLERIRAIDPLFQPKETQARRAEKRDGLVFIDVDEAAAAFEPGAVVVAPLEGLEQTSFVPPVETLPHELAVEPQEFVAPEDPVARAIDVEPTVIDDVPVKEEAVPETLLSEASAPENSLSDKTDKPAPDEPFLDEPREPVQAEVTEDAVFSGPAESERIQEKSAHEFEYSVSSDEASPLEGLAASLGEPSDVVAAPEPVLATDDQFTDLAQWLRDTEPTPSGDDEFGQMLETFKRGVAESVDDGDSESHYELGLAYSEMGLAGEAVAQFEKAIRGAAPADRRLRAYEALGQCYLDGGQYESAVSALVAALTEPGLADDKLVGVLYLLGYAAECLGRRDEARAYYSRVIAVDPVFRDVEQRYRLVSP